MDKLIPEIRLLIYEYSHNMQYTLVMKEMIVYIRDYNQNSFEECKILCMKLFLDPTFKPEVTMVNKMIYDETFRQGLIDSKKYSMKDIMNWTPI